MLAKLDYILKRLAMSALVLLGLSIITFALARVVPSNPAALYVGPRARPEQVEVMTIKLGLDRPLYVQYLYYLRDALHGDLGTSIATKRPVVQEITERLPSSLELLAAGISLATVVGVILGVLSARLQGSPFDTLVRVFSLVGVSLPTFWLALLLILLFSVTLHGLGLPYLPPEGATSAIGGGGFVDRITHLMMPATALA